MKITISILTLFFMTSMNLHAQEPGMVDSDGMPTNVTKGDPTKDKPFWKPYWSGSSLPGGKVPEGACDIQVNMYEPHPLRGPRLAGDPSPGQKIVVEVEGIPGTLEGTTGEEGTVHFLIPMPDIGTTIKIHLPTGKTITDKVSLQVEGRVYDAINHSGPIH